MPSFSREESKKSFLDSLGKLVDWMKDNEPETTIYAFYEDKDDPLKVCAFEQWTNEEAFQAHHCSTDQCNEFIKVFQAMAES